MAVKFNKFNVCNGAHKARVHYSLDNRGDGRKCVTVYAKDYGHALGKVFADGEYVNNTDSQTDYFETGRAVLFEDHPEYAKARPLVEAWALESRTKSVAKRLTKQHERFSAGFYLQAAEGRTRCAGARVGAEGLELLEVATGEWFAVDVASMVVFDHSNHRLYV